MQRSSQGDRLHEAWLLSPASRVIGVDSTESGPAPAALPGRGTPAASWRLTARDFAANGGMIGEPGLSTLIVQEGGYRTRTLGLNARRFLEGFLAGARQH